MQPEDNSTHTSQGDQISSREKQSNNNSLGVPIAIVIAAVLIAGAIMYSGKQNTPTPKAGVLDTAQETPEIEIAPVTEKDHIQGNPNAPIMIVEYSDFECPFCKNFHETMTKIIAEYGKGGKVAWVYRQFPLEQLHPNAPKIAAASECVANLGGNDAFWKFSDSIFDGRGLNELTNMAKLPDYAEEAGVSKDSFSTCVADGTYTETVKTAVADALKTGARGTPYSILMIGDQKGLINGAQPYDVVKKMIETVLTQIEA
ncbi:MAG: DsbA family protein [Candidatus Pacebacteria bacterium]|nr:DsbA family protein [Candidatus Paceibacterota bacterium]MCF7857211.1 DsbA family protein [Candidatus Paceibacterota bacterium]